MRRALPPAAAALLLLPAAAVAQTADVGEVIVTAGPLPTSIDSATTHVEILDRSKLDLAPPSGLGDTLSGLPGLRSTAFAPGASRPVIRGLSGPRVLILENGVGMVDASSLSPDHAVAADPAEATRIEVLRGPSTLAYGGSGIGGVVNVLDQRVPSSPAAGGIEGRLSAAYGTGDDGRSVSAGAKIGEGPFVFALDGASRRSDDYAAPTPTGRVANSDSALDAYGAGASYVHDRGYVGASIRRTESAYGVPYPAGPAAGGEGPVGISLRQTRIDVRGEQDLDLGPFDRVRVSVGHAKYRHQEVARDTGEIGTTFLSGGTEGRLELTQSDRGGWTGAMGVQGLSRTLEAIGDEAFIPPVKITEGGVFVLQRLDRGGWGVEGGLRLDRRRLEAPTEAHAFTNLSGSVGLFAKPSEPWFLALSLSHNRRAPTEVELYADGPHEGTSAFEVGDVTLQSETVNSAEATLRWARDDVRLESHLYAARYDGFIDELPTGAVVDDLPVYRFVATDARFVGAEAEADWTFWRAGANSLAIESTLDWVRGSSDLGPVARMPPVAATGRLVFKGERIDAQAELRHVAAQDRTATFETPTDGYDLVNLRVSFRPFAGKDLRLFAEARNLTDALAREHVSFLKDVAPLAGRTFRVGLSASL